MRRIRHVTTFAVASCQYPASTLDAAVAYASYARLAARLDGCDAKQKPRCLLLLGDQVYLDAKAGLFDPLTDHERFVFPYERWLRQPEVRSVLRRLPAHMMLDDHELEADWEPRPSGTRDHVFDNGIESFIRYQTIANPSSSGRRIPGLPLWYAFEEEGLPFFVLDTRTERTARTAATVAQSEIVSPHQLAALEKWLFRLRNDSGPKFVGSPSPFLPRHREGGLGDPSNAVRSDGWCGYPTQFFRLMAFIARHRITNVVFLCGDTHLCCVSKAELRWKNEPPILVHSVVSSPRTHPIRSRT